MDETSSKVEEDPLNFWLGEDTQETASSKLDMEHRYRENKRNFKSSFSSNIGFYF